VRMTVYPRFTAIFHENVDSSLNFDRIHYLSVYIAFHKLTRRVQKPRITDILNLIIMNKNVEKIEYKNNYQCVIHVILQPYPTANK